MRALYSDFIWRKPETEKKIYLTFDDGPVPEVSEFVLETLEKYRAKATFFCVGDNISKNPTIFKKILDGKHSVGNHTYNHLRGWETDDATYLANVIKCQTEIRKNGHDTRLFRPPYGRIRRGQANSLLRDYEIIMWDILSGDFSQKLSPELVLRKTIEHTKAGSIIVFHDSIKASGQMSYALPRVLEHFSEKEFEFLSL